MSNRLVLLMLIVMSCTTAPDRTRIVDYRLEPYVQAFEHEYGHPITFKFVMGDLKPGIDGQCDFYDDGSQEAYISMTFYTNKMQDTNNQYSYSLEQVVFHEIGHCQLILDHDPKLVNNFPESIMYPYTFWGSQIQHYITFRGYYINQLLGR